MIDRLEYKGGIYAPAADIAKTESGEVEEIVVPVSTEDALAGAVPYKPFQKWFLKEAWFLKGYGEGERKGAGKFKYLAAGDELPKGGKWMPAEKMPEAAARVFIRIDAVKICSIGGLNSFDAKRMGYSDVDEMIKDLMPKIHGYIAAMQITALHY